MRVWKPSNIKKGTITAVWLEGGGGGSLPSPFSEIWKKYPNSGEKYPDYGICGWNFSFKMQVIRVSRGKNPNIFPFWAFLFRVVEWSFIEVP